MFARIKHYFTGMADKGCNLMGLVDVGLPWSRTPPACG